MVSIATWLALIGMGLLTIVVLGAFFLSFVMNASSSPIWWPVTAFLAGISLLVIFGVILLADRWDPQPIPLLLIAVLWGAAVAAGSSFLLNSINGLIFYAVGGEGFATGPLVIEADASRARRVDGPMLPPGRLDPDGATRARAGVSGRCLLYTSPSPRDKRQSRMPSSA